MGGEKNLIFRRKDMTKTLRLQTGFSDGSNSPTNIGGSNTGVDWVPFYIEETEGKEESEKHNSSSDEESCTGRRGRGGKYNQSFHKTFNSSCKTKLQTRERKLKI